MGCALSKSEAERARASFSGTDAPRSFNPLRHTAVSPPTVTFSKATAATEPDAAPVESAASTANEVIIDAPVPPPHSAPSASVRSDTSEGSAFFTPIAPPRGVKSNGSIFVGPRTGIEMGTKAGPLDRTRSSRNTLNPGDSGTTGPASPRTPLLTLLSDMQDEAKRQSFVNHSKHRRTGVTSGSTITPSPSEPFSPPVHPKDESTRSWLAETLTGSVLFTALDAEQQSIVVGAMFQVHVAPGETVIRQGDAGDNCYVVESGALDIFVAPIAPGGSDYNPEGIIARLSSTGAGGPSPASLGRKVAEASAGTFFGELALMYNCPRAASVRAVTPSSLWALDRATFRHILVDSTIRARDKYEQFLSLVPLLSALAPHERAQIADVLVTATYEDGEYIITQGDLGTKFYLLLEGEARATVCVPLGTTPEEVEAQALESGSFTETGGSPRSSAEDGMTKPTRAPTTLPPIIPPTAPVDPPPSAAPAMTTETIMAYGPGAYFGEVALLKRGPRRANVVACGHVKCAEMDVDSFIRIMGPVRDLMERTIESYTPLPSARISA